MLSLHTRVISMADSSHATRSISFDALQELQTGGYRSIRVAGTSRIFDLIAWKGEEILFLVVRRSRSVGIGGFADTVRDLAGFVREKVVPGPVQFWLYRSNTWLRYRILPGGAVPIRGIGV